MYIKESEIQRIFNDRNWAVAKAYQRKDVIEHLDIEENQMREWYKVSADVEVFTYNNHVELILSKTGDIISFSCECRYCEDEVACGHIGVVLLFLHDLKPTGYPYHYDASIKREDELKNWMLQRQLEQSKSFLNAYKRISDSEFQANLIANKIRLIAYLNHEYQSLHVTFKVGNDKFYVVKNILTFLEAVEHRSQVYYGKSLSFVHHPDAFDDTTKQMINFLMKYRQEHISELEYGYLDKRSITLDKRSLDDFYDFFSEEGACSIDCNFAYDEIETIPLHIQKDSIGYVITTSLDLDTLYEGKAYWYCFKDKCLSRFIKEIHDTCTYLLQQLHKDRQIVIAHQDMHEFCQYVYSQIEDYVELSGDPIDEFMDDEPDLSCYIDMEDNGDISVQIYAMKNGLKQSIFDQEGHAGLRIERAIMLIKNYADVIDYDAKTAYIANDSHQIMSFLKDGLAYLDSFCDVFVSDAIKQLNSPKPVNFKVGVRMENNLLQVDVKSVNIPQDEIYAVLKSYRKKKKYHRLKNGDLIYLEQESIQEIDDMMQDLHVSATDFANGSIQLPVYHSFEVDDLSNNIQHAQMKRSKNFEDTLHRLRHIKHDSFKLPDGYENILRDYQVFGYQWLKTMSAYGFGAILADDMGLGKTVQMIAVLEDEKLQNPDSISLIVTPASLIFNWQDEIHKFSNNLHCLCIHGSVAQRQNKILSMSEYDVIVTSYDYLRRDHEYYEKHVFNYIILDEAQYIKNHTTKNASVVKALKGNHRFAMTGTPIENSLAELWSIFDFLMPGYLYNYNFFRKFYEKEVVKFQNKEVIAKLKRMVEPFILRRLKKDVLKELPDKIERVQYLEFNEEEEKLYMANLVQINKELQAKLHVEVFDKFQILAMMTRLRQICCDPRLLYENIDTVSSKIEGCMELIQSAKATDKKVLVFSSFTSLLELLEKEFYKEDISYVKLTGETSKEKRRKYVQIFQDKQVDVFLISLKAGGTGLNLTSAEVVIHVDPWWNMSAQNQATDRAYRIGQTENVQVYKMIMKNSIEEKILKLQEMKKDLSDTFTQGSEGSITSMNQEEILSLFQ